MAKEHLSYWVLYWVYVIYIDLHDKQLGYCKENFWSYNLSVVLK